MIKYSYIFIISVILICSGCKGDDPVTPPPVTGEVLLAEVSGDSTGTLGLSTVVRSITGQSLDFTGRDSARITFYYSGTNNTTTVPFQIYYVVDTNNVNIYSALNLTITPTEQYADITLPSPAVNQFCRYQISVLAANGIFGYFKFRDLKIYKK
ncbi:MAG: hypothetical protein SGI89_12000 [bacterium]|nr:hypothetical protein [bacterium]